MTSISFWETSDLLVKHLHHRQKASLIILYYKIGYDSNNLVFSGLSLASSQFRLGEIFALDRYSDPKTNSFLEYIQRLYKRAFFVIQFKNLIDSTDQFEIKKCRKVSNFSYYFSVICFQSLLFWNKSEYIEQASTVFFASKQSLYGSIAYKLKKLWIQNFEGFFLMLKRSFICCYTTCMSLPLNQEHILFITLLAINKYFFCCINYIYTVKLKETISKYLKL